MSIETTIAAQQSWPEAAVAIVGTALIGGVVVVWQALVTWRARIAVVDDEAYQQLARQLLRLNELRSDGEGATDRGHRGFWLRRRLADMGLEQA